MYTPLTNKSIVLGVCGSIAAYKAAVVASLLAQAGAQVEVILTQSAQKFITPLTFKSLTNQNAYTDDDLWGQQGHILHVGLGHKADLIVIAPATANTIAKLAHGSADNLLTLTALAGNCPLLIAPAMDSGMYNHPATQDNISKLQQRGLVFAGPTPGRLASGMVGYGRMVEPEELFGNIRLLLSQKGPLAGYKLVITAGGTWEPIDPVRAIVNRSSGKQGFALAQVALDIGGQVTLISAPTHLPTPQGAKLVEVLTAQEMHQAVINTLPETDILLMAAAVADFKPQKAEKNKIKRNQGVPQINLTKTPDILAAVAEIKFASGFPRVTVGFAAESQKLVENARQKLMSKQLDLIVANDISANDAGFAVDTNRVTIISRDGAVESLPLMSKVEVAEKVLQWVIKLLA